jgi:energy-converting hydrogenase Eha subunit C
VLNALFCLLIVDNLKLEPINSIIRISLIKEGELYTLFAYNAFIDEIACSKVYNKFNKYYAFAVTFIKIALDFKEKFI